MDNRAEVREFLMSRRAKLAPGAAGLPAGPNRRVKGLRRSEAATLAGVSVEYYAKLERGAIAGASASVLDALARALHLDDTEHAHLLDLARAADGIPSSGRSRRRSARPAVPRESLEWVLASITEAIAFVRDPQQNMLAVNPLGRAFYQPMCAPTVPARNASAIPSSVNSSSRTRNSPLPPNPAGFCSSTPRNRARLPPND